jgi:prophage regulatory protein
MGRATVWRKAKDEPDFPKPVKVSPKITGWIEAEVDQYLEAKVSKARGERAQA